MGPRGVCSPHCRIGAQTSVAAQWDPEDTVLSRSSQSSGTGESDDVALASCYRITINGAPFASSRSAAESQLRTRCSDGADAQRGLPPIGRRFIAGREKKRCLAHYRRTKDQPRDFVNLWICQSQGNIVSLKKHFFRLLSLFSTAHPRYSTCES